MHRCTPTRDAWLKSATYLGIPRKFIQRPWPGGPTRKGCRTRLLLLGDAFQRHWQGGPPQGTHQNNIVILLLQGNAFWRLWPGGSPRRVPPRKCSRTKSFLSEFWPGVPPGKAPEQDCYYQEMPSRSSGQGVPLAKALERDSNYLEKL